MSLILLIVPLITALLCLMIRNQKFLMVVNSLGAVIIFIISMLIARQVFSGSILVVGQYVYIDALAALIVCIIAVVGLMAAIYSLGYTNQDIQHGEFPASRLKWYYFWFYIFIFTMISVVISANLGIMWVSVEATTLATALLVGFYDRKGSLEAAWKYIIICTVGIIFALFGTILLHYAAVSVTGEGGSSLNWLTLYSVAKQLDPKLLKLAFIFVLVGYGTKVGLAPMHTWLPDAHSQAPSPISAMLSGVLLNCAFYTIIRFHMIVSKSLGTQFSANLLLIFGVMSIAVALPFIIVQHDIKRLLAYSSIEHMGIIAAAVGLGSKLALFGAFLHMINHAFTKSSLFFASGNVSQYYRTKKIARIKGLVTAMPLTGPVLLLGGFAIAGSPPFNIFLSEFYILSAGFAQGRYLVSSLILLLITLIFTGIIYNMSKMFFGTPPGKIKVGEPGKLVSVMGMISLVPICVLGVYIPPFIQNILQQVAVIILGGK